MTQDTAKYAKELLENFQRAEAIFDNIALLKEDGGTLTLDFNGKSTGRVFVIGIDGYSWNNVTHWQHLPQPPKKGD